jgi:hypothetical protein
MDADWLYILLLCAVTVLGSVVQWLRKRGK